MFEFIKTLFRKKDKQDKQDTQVDSASAPILIHADIGETIVIKEVKLTPVTLSTAKVKPVKEKLVVVKEVKPVVVKEVKPKVSKPKKVKAEPAKIVQLVQPTPAKKKGRPKKNTTDNQS